VTSENNSNRFWGSTDLPLSQTGIEQAGRLRERLATERIDTIYSSLLSRSRTTAEIIASSHGLGIYARSELNECDFGEAEGLTFDEINARFPGLADALLGDDTATRFPGGESLLEVFARVGRFREELDDHGADSTICIVGHGASLQTLICHLLGVPPGHWRQFCLQRGSLSIIETYPGGAVLAGLNDINHLEGVD